MIGGPMGVGKTTVCGILKKRLDNCVLGFRSVHRYPKSEENGN